MKLLENSAIKTKNQQTDICHQ